MACRLALQAAEALDFLNARNHLIGGQRTGVQHCDIKPNNLLLFGETVKLCDFGLASVTTSPSRPTAAAGRWPTLPRRFSRGASATGPTSTPSL